MSWPGRKLAPQLEGAVADHLELIETIVIVWTDLFS